MFSKEKFLAMVNANKDNDFVLKMIVNYMNALGDYVASVYRMEMQMPILRFRLDGEEFRDAVMDLDRARRIAHESAIAACGILNRICEKSGVENLFDGNVEDRNEVADFCMSAVDTIFKDRAKKRHSLEEMVEAAEK